MEGFFFFIFVAVILGQIFKKKSPKRAAGHQETSRQHTDVNAAEYDWANGVSELRETAAKSRAAVNAARATLQAEARTSQSSDQNVKGIKRRPPIAQDMNKKRINGVDSQPHTSFMSGPGVFAILTFVAFVLYVSTII